MIKFAKHSHDTTKAMYTVPNGNYNADKTLTLLGH